MTMSVMTGTDRWPKGWRKVLNRPQFWIGAIALVVTFAWYGMFVFGPVLKTFVMSMQNYRVLNPASSPFVGLDNFIELFGYDRFWIAVWNTLVYTVLLYAFSLPISLLLAWCLARVTRGRQGYQFVIFLPVVVSIIAISMLFRMIMNPDTGTLNQLLALVGLPPSNWIFGSDSAIGALVLVEVWKSVGFYVVLLTAAILAVPTELNDAAIIDGANPWQTFFNVTLPSIMPTVAAVSILTVVNGMLVYVTPTVLGPGPGLSTLMINEFIVDEAFASFLFSSAAAVSVFVFLLMLLITVVQLFLLRSKGDQ
jgi:multiple sugar transport system permease protein